MVVLRGLVAALLVMLATCAQAQLTASVARPSVALGEPILLRLTARDLDLAEVDLAPLAPDFEVYARAATRSEVRGRVHSTLELTLYPRRSGVLTVPPLGFARLRSAPVTVEVDASRADAAPVHIEAGIDSDTPMERQPLLLIVRIRDDGTQQWQRPVPIAPGSVHLQPIEERQREIEREGRTATEHEYRWSLLALKPGSATVEFGMLEAFRFGERLRYPAPALSFRAVPAPAFLPAYVPVGRPRLETGALPREIVVGRPATWTWRLEAPGLGSEGVAAWLRIENKKARGLRFYPVSVRPDRDGRWEIALSFVAERAGALVLPAFTLPYFEPGTQSIEQLRIRPAALSARDLTAERINRLGVAALALILVSWLAQRLRPWLARWRAKRAWLRRVHAAIDAAALEHALRVEGPQPGVTLRRWAAALGVHGELVDALERNRFARQAADAELAALREAWEQAARRLPLARFT